MRRYCLFGCAGLVALMAATSAYAQAGATAQAQAQADSTQIASPGSTTLNEVVVTAQKRVQNINDVPISITAISGDQLKLRQINSLEDIANVVPGLTFSNSITNTPIYTLRGVGFSDSSLAAYPDVAIYIDEVPLSLPILSKLTSFDLERVEVLKGPQGTLFGNNATGGAINFVTAKPTKSFEAGADVSYGRFNTTIANGYVSGPVTDTVQARLAGHIEDGGPWQQGYTTSNRNGAPESYAGRLLIDWEATSKLKLSFDINAWEDKSEPQEPQFLLYRSNIPGVDAAPGIVNYPTAPNNDRAADFSNRAFADNTFAQAAARATYALTHDITVTSLTSYSGYEQKEGYDQDGVTYQDFDVPSDYGNIESFSQELRIDNGSSSRLRWVGGLNFSHDKVYEHDTFTYKDSSASNALHVTSGAAQSRQDMHNYAAFGNGEFDLTHKLTLIGGLRYTEADRNYDGCTIDVPGGLDREVFNFIASEVSGTAVPIPPPASCITIRNNYLSQGNFVDKLDESNVSWRAGLNYKLQRDMLLYVNVAKGYKAGSFPTQPASLVVQFYPVKQESVLDYEGGFKLGLLDHRLQLNGAGFYYDYTNKQLLSKLADPVFGLLNNLQNVPKSSIKGGEFEIVARVMPGLSVALNATYLSASIDKFTGYNAAGLFKDFAGAAFPYTPKYQLSFAPNYEHPITDVLTGFVGVQVNYRSSTTAVIGGSDIVAKGEDAFAIDGYTLVDGQLGVRTADGRWEGQVWAKNLFNTYYWNNVLVGYDTLSRYTGLPATYGVTLKYRFR